MPYVTCRRCGLTVYTAARLTSIDHCPGCGTELDRDRRDPSLVKAAQRALARNQRAPLSDRAGRRTPSA